MSSHLKTANFILMSICLVSCSLAPRSNPHSAKSNGKGNFQVEYGGNILVAEKEKQKKNETEGENTDSSMKRFMPSLRVSYGVTEKLDLGYVSEVNEFWTQGLTQRYSFIRDFHGLSWSEDASIGTAGLLGTSGYYYIGTTIGYEFTPRFLTFINARYNKILMDDFWDGSTYPVEYGSVGLGVTYYPIKELGLNISANVLFNHSGTIAFIYPGLNVRF